jgi:toxin YoeB
MRSVSNDSDPLIPQRRRKATLRAILKEMLRGDPAVGLRKPERLGHNLAGFWSRRLSQKDRVIYTYDDDRTYIFAIGGHYDDK